MSRRSYREAACFTQMNDVSRNKIKGHQNKWKKKYYFVRLLYTVYNNGSGWYLSCSLQLFFLLDTKNSGKPSGPNGRTGCTVRTGSLIFPRSRGKTRRQEPVEASVWCGVQYAAACLTRSPVRVLVSLLSIFFSRFFPFPFFFSFLFISFSFLFFLFVLIYLFIYILLYVILYYSLFFMFLLFFLFYYFLLLLFFISYLHFLFLFM